MSAVRILGIAGSLRRDSHNAELLRAVAQVLPPGVELEVFGGLKAIPPFDADDEALPGTAVIALREAITRSDAVLVATPEYNSSLPGVLKNALDWASRPVATNVLRNKPAAVVGASTGMFGAIWAQAEGRKVLAAIGARVIDSECPVPGAGEDGWLHDEVHDALRTIVAELVAGAAKPVAAAA